MPPTVPKTGARGHWVRSGEFRRIQADPDKCRQSPRFTLEHARTPDKRGAVECARTAGIVAAEVISPWGAPASDRGRSGAWSRPGRRAALALASPTHRQSRRETAKGPERAARPGVTTGSAWSDQRRALAFLLAFFPALKPDFAAFFPALKPDFAALSSPNPPFQLTEQPTTTRAEVTQGIGGCPGHERNVTADRQACRRATKGQCARADQPPCGAAESLAVSRARR
jgi:hypothetical protein